MTKDVLQQQSDVITNITNSFCKTSGQSDMSSHTYDTLSQFFVQSVELLYKMSPPSGLSALSKITSQPENYNVAFVDIAQRLTIDLTGPR